MSHTLRVLAFLGILFSAVFCTAPPKQTTSKSETTKGRRLEVLFLGDNGHHKPIERIPALMAALGPKGINFTYTDNLEDVNPENLNKYDALLVYANWDSIPAAQDKALTDYVNSGKGLVAVHCASWCFRNSEAYVQMVGGQFLKHGWDTIQSIISKPEHPVVANLKNFKTLDETYIHQKLSSDNLVLTERQEGDKREPYTWVRNVGKGRVFYTAYGHDENTWNNPGFHELMEKGIRWAVGQQAENELKALNPQPFTYTEAKLPNYEKRPDPQLRQAALSPEESMKHIQVPVDFTLELFAHEPDVMHPIAMTWDERGRLFVLITKDYPNERKDMGGSDYILLCEDTNQDGKADKFTRYADGLSIPTGLVCYDGGLIVTQAPHVLFLKDTNGDDKADERKILLTGFGTFDTHAGPSNLHYGFDNWIWGSVGYSGFKGKVGADSLKFGQGFFRFKPDGSQLEYMTVTSNNTWGFAFNETGDVFGSTANNAHGWYMPIPYRYAGWGEGSRSTDTHKDMKPITTKVRQVDVFGGFTAAAGHNFYTARAFPKKYWNRVAFVAEPTGHVLHQNVMEKKGTDYEDREGFNLMAGADEWFSPVFAETGPDGAVWVADWYSFIIQHNPTPKGFDNGPGNAYVTDLRDYTHGRIYRVAYKNAPPYKPLSLSKDRPQELVAALKNDNLFWRQAAQRLLVERGNRDVVPQLLALVKDQSLDEIGINPPAIHALWTLQGLGVITEQNPEVLQAAQNALTHACAGVRKTAVQILPRTSASAEKLLQVKALQDKEPLVVLNTLLAFAEMPPTPAVPEAVLTRMEQATETEDRWLPDAFACVLKSHDAKLLKTYLNRLKAQAATQPKSTPSMASMDHSHHASAQKNSISVKPETPPVSGTQPDLVVANLRTEPASPFVRESIKLFVEVKNQGGAAVPQGTVVPLSLRIEGASKKVSIVSLTFANGIAPGETVTIDKESNGPWTGPLGFTSDKAGEYTFNVTVDYNTSIAESDETNNTHVHKLIYQAPQKLSVFALERAVKSYAGSSSIDSVISLLRQSQKLDADNRQALIKGASEGWDKRKKVTLSPSDQTFLASLSNTVPADSRDRLGRLSEAWGMVSETPKDAQLIQLKAIREALKFDKAEFTVKAGKPVEVVFENPDAMQHNLVIGKPKTMEIIGNAADKMITAKDGAEKNYVPSIPQVLFSTPLVNPDQKYRLRFTAPTQPGEYPFVCTFPGHWRIMNGVMKVVK
ncbi:MAG: ThuA domain-containing protein [Cytophagales bacterium]|jgi:putative membrane-bound dehydrogenase-like protein|nr:ThuA domain-containing protein [Cytophagales bacterium]